MDDYNEYLDFAKKLALNAGKIMWEHFFAKNNKVLFKEDRTPVTEADRIINDYVIMEVKKHYPTHSVDGEEQKNIQDSEYVWVLDPIDGTSMFTRHVPVAVFSLALVVNGEVKVGVVYDPFLEEMYTAIKGEGAFLNNKPIHVSDKEYGSLGSSIDICMWTDAKYDTLKLIEQIRDNNKTSQLGSTAHASMLVARGTISAEIFPGSEHGHCDIAASSLIVSEAGGTVTNFWGEDQRYDRDIDGCVLSNGVTHEKLLKLIRSTYE